MKAIRVVGRFFIGLIPVVAFMGLVFYLGSTDPFAMSGEAEPMYAWGETVGVGLLNFLGGFLILVITGVLSWGIYKMGAGLSAWMARWR